MTSGRLPGKVLLEVQGKSLLEYQIERLKRVASVQEVVVATTINGTDEPIVALCKKLGVKVFRGDENDVLGRYYGAAQMVGAETVVRVTSDCPLIDPAVIERAIKIFNSDGADYVSNTIERTYPRGMDCEVFSFAALERAFKEAKAEPEREHVTPYLYRNPDKFKLKQFTMTPDRSSERWTVDTAEDFELIKRMLEALKGEFTLDDCLRLIDQHPDWRKINAEIEQKKLSAAD